MDIGVQIFWLFVLAIPIAAISWTFTHEEVFREVHTYLENESRGDRPLFQRKIFYLLACEFCLSHWVTILVLIVARFRLLIDDWRGYGIAFFSLAWVANHYMSFFARLRLDVKRERVEIAMTETGKRIQDESAPQ